jgi:hypothetical protein
MQQQQKVGHNSRVYKLNSSDVYSISNNGRIKAIHNNKEIVSEQIKNSKIRPKSGKYSQRRPWSNRSFRRKNSGSSASRGKGNINNRTDSSSRPLIILQIPYQYLAMKSQQSH